MTIDATKPSDAVLVSELPAYIREGRVEMNTISLAGTGAVGAQTLDVDMKMVHGMSMIPAG